MEELDIIPKAPRAALPIPEKTMLGPSLGPYGKNRRVQGDGRVTVSSHTLIPLRQKRKGIKAGYSLGLSLPAPAATP